MDYGGCDKRRTKKDLKRKRIARGYKRGGKFRVTKVEEGKSTGKANSGKEKE